MNEIRKVEYIMTKLKKKLQTFLKRLTFILLITGQADDGCSGLMNGPGHLHEAHHVAAEELCGFAGIAHEFGGGHETWVEIHMGNR